MNNKHLFTTLLVLVLSAFSSVCLATEVSVADSINQAGSDSGLTPDASNVSGIWSYSAGQEEDDINSNMTFAYTFYPSGSMDIIVTQTLDSRWGHIMYKFKDTGTWRLNGNYLIIKFRIKSCILHRQNKIFGDG